MYIFKGWILDISVGSPQTHGNLIKASAAFIAYSCDARGRKQLSEAIFTLVYGYLIYPVPDVFLVVVIHFDIVTFTIVGRHIHGNLNFLGGGSLGVLPINKSGRLKKDVPLLHCHAGKPVILFNFCVLYIDRFYNSMSPHDVPPPR